MNVLVITTFVACFLVEYLARKLELISIYFVLLPELLSGMVMVVVLARLIGGKRLMLGAFHLWCLAALLLTMAMGVVAQEVPSGAIVSGLRDYVRFLPFLLLGAIYPFTERQLRGQLLVLAVLVLIQVPVAYYQRFFSFAHKMHTGDVVTGTVSSSAALSIVMVAGIAVLAVLYLKRRLSLALLAAATAVLLLPTMLNETKGTLLMLPVAMFAPLFCIRRTERPFRRLLPLAVLLGASGMVFVGAYNAMLQYRNPGATLQEFWLEGGAEHYVYKGTVEGDHRVGRLDSVQLAARGISQTPLRAAFGLGIGNVSTAKLPGFEGEYARFYNLYKVSFTQLSMLLWNVGYVGLMVFGLLFVAMFRDAWLLARSGGPHETLGQIWAPMMMIAGMCIFYKPILTMNEIIYPFMFYAGVVGRNAFLTRRELRARRDERMPARVAGRQGPQDPFDFPAPVN